MEPLNILRFRRLVEGNSKVIAKSFQRCDARSQPSILLFGYAASGICRDGGREGRTVATVYWD